MLENCSVMCPILLETFENLSKILPFFILKQYEIGSFVSSWLKLFLSNIGKWISEQNHAMISNFLNTIYSKFDFS